LLGGPICGVAALVTSNQTAAGWLVPACFLCHGLFYVGVLVVCETDFTEAKLNNSSDALWKPYRNELADDQATQDIETAHPEPQQTGNKPDLHGITSVPEKRGKGLGSAETGWTDQATGACTWPTENPLFDAKIKAVNTEIRGVVRWTVLASCVLFFSMSLWSVARYWFPQHQQTLRIAGELQMDFSSALFQPQHIACGGGHVFLADRYHIHELLSEPLGGRRSSPLPCRPNGTISDISVECDALGCWPMVLMHDDSGVVGTFNCRTGENFAFLQQGHYERTHLLPGSIRDKRLLAALNRDAVQYRRGDGTWEAEWPLEAIGSETIQALSSSAKGNLLLFYSTSLQVRNSATMRDMGMWSLPVGMTPVVGGCGVDSDSTALLLPRAEPLGEGHKRRLVIVHLDD